MNWPNWLARRLASAALMVWAAATLVFALATLAPGDPLTAIAGEHQSASTRAALSASLGLDRAWPARYLGWIAGLAAGDLGTAYSHSRPVLSVIAERLPVTLAVALPALAGAAIGAVLLALAGGRRPHALPARLSAALALGLSAMPVFWLARLLVQGASLELGWFPAQGLSDIRAEHSGLAAALDLAWHLALPVAAVLLHQLAMLLLLTQGGLRQEAASDYFRTALAKGLTQEMALRRHALPLALAPVVALLGTRIGGLLTATALVEISFGLPGIGRLLVDATLARDHPLVLGVFVCVVLMTVLGNLLADLATRALDPRTRLAGAAA
ncbi:MAG: ABC transporter permease [Burkholderiaceae bacterium]